MNAEQLVKFAARRAEKMFNRRGEVLWMYHFIREDGQHGLFAPPPFLQDKDQIVAAVKALFRAENVTAYVFMNEGWSLPGGVKSKEDYFALLDRHGGSLENVPGRQETILFVAEDTGRMVCGMMPIHRPEGQKPYLGALEIYHPDGAEGEMMGLLPTRGGMQ